MVNPNTARCHWEVELCVEITMPFGITDCAKFMALVCCFHFLGRRKYIARGLTRKKVSPLSFIGVNGYVIYFAMQDSIFWVSFSPCKPREMMRPSGSKMMMCGMPIMPYFSVGSLIFLLPTITGQGISSC